MKKNIKSVKLLVRKSYDPDSEARKIRRKLTSHRYQAQFNAKIAKSIHDYAQIETDETKLAIETCNMLLAR